jgi:hypothetical protein
MSRASGYLQIDEQETVTRKGIVMQADVITLDELKGEDEPERKSQLSRLASKRKSRNFIKDESESTTAGTATGAAAVTTGTVAGPTVDTEKSTEAREATRSIVTDAEVVGASSSPVHAKDLSSSKAKPNLERHITNI